LTGSISEISAAGNRLFVSMHLTPSASNTLVLTRDLRIEKELNGWPVKSLEQGMVVFENSQTHFAPTHPTELSAYDLVRNVERKIYPPAKADPVRQDFVNRLREAYVVRGEEWFRTNNHHMNPEKFDSSLGLLEADEKTHAIAFTVWYFNPINDANDPRASEQTVVATCTSMDRIDRISCKERPLDVWAQAVGMSASAIVGERGTEAPVTRDLLRRAAANPALVP
jgi:hypothetical protein